MSGYATYVVMNKESIIDQFVDWHEKHKAGKQNSFDRFVLLPFTCKYVQFDDVNNNLTDEEISKKLEELVADRSTGDETNFVLTVTPSSFDGYIVKAYRTDHSPNTCIAIEADDLHFAEIVENVMLCALNDPRTF